MVVTLLFFLMAIMKLMVFTIMAGTDHQIGKSIHVCPAFCILNYAGSFNKVATSTPNRSQHPQLRDL